MINELADDDRIAKVERDLHRAWLAALGLKRDVHAVLLPDEILRLAVDLDHLEVDLMNVEDVLSAVTLLTVHSSTVPARIVESTRFASNCAGPAPESMKKVLFVGVFRRTVIVATTRATGSVLSNT